MESLEGISFLVIWAIAACKQRGKLRIFTELTLNLVQFITDDGKYSYLIYQEQKKCKSSVMFSLG